MIDYQGEDLAAFAAKLELNGPLDGVYLLHLSKPLSHARHYVGFSTDILHRLRQHLEGHQEGSPMIRAALRQGIEVKVVRVWVGRGRQWERRIKDQKCSGRHCFLCRAERMERENRHARARKAGKRLRLERELWAIEAHRKELAK